LISFRLRRRFHFSCFHYFEADFRAFVSFSLPPSRFRFQLLYCRFISYFLAIDAIDYWLPLFRFDYSRRFRRHFAAATISTLIFAADVSRLHFDTFSFSLF
jgi:hypothetical protein